MTSRVVSAILAVGLGYNLLAVTPRIANWRLPGDQRSSPPGAGGPPRMPAEMKATRKRAFVARSPGW